MFVGICARPRYLVRKVENLLFWCLIKQSMQNCAFQGDTVDISDKHRVSGKYRLLRPDVSPKRPAKERAAAAC